MSSRTVVKIKIVSRKIVHPVKLAEEERKELYRYLHQGIASARSLNRARMLLMADEGYSDDYISKTLQVAKSTVARRRGIYCQEGLESALKEKPRSGAPPKIDGRAKAEVVTIACSKPPDGRSRWTLRLMADRAVELNVVDSISHTTIHRILKKMKRSRGRRSNGV